MINVMQTTMQFKTPLTWYCLSSLAKHVMASPMLGRHCLDHVAAKIKLSSCSQPAMVLRRRQYLCWEHADPTERYGDRGVHAGGHRRAVKEQKRRPDLPQERKTLMRDLKIDEIMKNVFNALSLVSSKASFLNIYVLYQEESEAKSSYSDLHLCSWCEVVTSELSGERMGWVWRLSNTRDSSASGCLSFNCSFTLTPLKRGGQFLDLEEASSDFISCHQVLPLLSFPT